MTQPTNNFKQLNAGSIAINIDTNDTTQSNSNLRIYQTPVQHLPADLYVPPQAFAIWLEQFAGPLDFLLYLCNMKKLVLIMLAILMLSACKTTTKIVEVPVEVVKKEYIYDTKIDSVYIRDSVDRWQKGDTLYITKWHTKFKYINKVDTIVKTDSIPKIVPVVKEVEVNHIYWWQKTLMWVGGILSTCIIISLIHKLKK